MDDSAAAWPAGWHVRRVATTGSTNDDLLSAGLAGAPDRTVLAADVQTAGRGRLDRRWEAPAGANLLVSVLLRDVPDALHTVTQRIALAARQAAARLVPGLDVVLKWPNDLLVRDPGGSTAKLAGILAQVGHGDSGPFVVVGLGMNVGWAPEGAARLGDALAPDAVLSAVLAAFDELPAEVGAIYRSHLATVGQQVRVELPGGRTVTGRAIDVLDDGRLVVLDDCAVTHRIDTGDVLHLRPR